MSATQRRASGQTIAAGRRAQERARIASDLLASLDSETVDEDEIDQLWSAETQRRAAMLESGDAGTMTWDEIEQRCAERRAQRGA